MAGINKDDVRKYKIKRKKVKGQGMSVVEKTKTGYGRDKVKTKKVDGFIVKKKTGTLLSRAMDRAAEFQSTRKRNADVSTSMNESISARNKSKAEKKY